MDDDAPPQPRENARLLSLPSHAAGQIHYSPASQGMAGARGTLLRDIDAALVNPALLALPGRSPFSLRLVGVGTTIDQNYMSIGRWNDFQGKFLTEADKNDILDGVTDGGRISALVEAQTLGVQIGSWAISTHTLVNLDTNLPRDLLEVALKGTELDRVYHFGKFGMNVESLSAITLSHGFALPIQEAWIPGVWWPVKRLYAGVNLNYYMGHGYARMEGGRADLRLWQDGMLGDAEFVYKVAGVPGGELDDENDDPRVLADTTYTKTPGSGFGIDLGIAGEISDAISFHAALVNIGAGVKWNASTYRAVVVASADTIAVGTFLELDDEAETTDLDSLTSHDVSFERIGSFRTNLPMVLRVGGTIQLGRLALNGELEKAFSEGFGYNRTPRLAVGLELRPLGFLPLRAGMSLGGRYGTMGAVGIGLDFKFLVFDLSVANSGITPNNINGLAVATGFKISF